MRSGISHFAPCLFIQASDRRRGQFAQHRTTLARAELSGRQGAMGGQGELDGLHDVMVDHGRCYRRLPFRR
ncbi:hypothetical protein D2T81_16830 [Azospirillum brasilense]|nr:hypothetical protein D2T81_16830 [Azospirillum brasilense]